MNLACFGLTLGLTAALLGLTGCRTVGETLGFAGAKGISNVVWNSPMEDIDPPKEGRNSIYVQYRDMSGAGIDIRDQVREHIRSRGYTLSKDPDVADYRLTATLRFFGVNPNNDGGRSTALGLGAITGVAAGVGTYAALDAVGAGQIASAGGGLGAGTLVGIASANHSTAREWNMIIDVVVAQRVDGGVHTSTTAGSRSDLATGTSVGTGGGTASGSQTATTERRQELTSTKSHILYPGRLTAWCSRWSLEREEAQQTLVPRIASALSNAVPPVD